MNCAGDSLQLDPPLPPSLSPSRGDDTSAFPLTSQVCCHPEPSSSALESPGGAPRKAGAGLPSLRCQPSGLLGDRRGPCGSAPPWRVLSVCGRVLVWFLAPCAVDSSGTENKAGFVPLGAAPSTTRHFHLRPVFAPGWGAAPPFPRGYINGPHLGNFFLFLRGQTCRA